MGILDKILGKALEQKEKLNDVWTPLTSIEAIDDLILESKQQSILIFKHSTRCSISRNVFVEFENKLLDIVNVKCYYLDLLSYRSISNEIVNRFNVEHQSPQVLIIKSGLVVESASHDNILEVDIYNLS